MYLYPSFLYSGCSSLRSTEMMSLKSIALGSVLCSLAAQTRLGKHAVQCPIMLSMMSWYECFQFPSCINISIRFLACTWLCVTCMFSMYSLSVTVDEDKIIKKILILSSYLSKLFQIVKIICLLLEKNLFIFKIFKKLRIMLLV